MRPRARRLPGRALSRARDRRGRGLPPARARGGRDLRSGGRDRGRRAHRVPRRRRSEGRGLRAPAQPARRGRGAAGRPGHDRRAAREHDRRARQPELAHRPRSGGPLAVHGVAPLAEVTHAAGRHRRRRDRACAGARAAAGGERLVRHSRTGHAVGKRDPRSDRAGPGSSAPAHDRAASSVAAAVVAVGPLRHARRLVRRARGGGRAGRGSAGRRTTATGTSSGIRAAGRSPRRRGWPSRPSAATAVSRGRGGPSSVRGCESGKTAHRSGLDCSLRGTSLGALPPS